ncbi:MAG: hypothetical protein O8C61_13420 [Candidatus Methanoperedens sp.]|nr:hypothetical protein [Candidatus Methanoperedens sp.]
MEKKLKFFFDKQGDVLDISIGEPKGAISKEMSNDIVMRIILKQIKLLALPF